MSELPRFTWDEIRKHDKDDDMWVVLGTSVFDVTDFVYDHPGGVAVLRDVAGKDGTVHFRTIPQHTSEYARSVLARFKIGKVAAEPPKQALPTASQLLAAKLERKITWDEVKQHSKLDDGWIAIDGRVYDITNFHLRHPGGPRPLQHYVGSDATVPFHRITGHAFPSAQGMLTGMLIGSLDGYVAPTASGAANSSAASAGESKQSGAGSAPAAGPQTYSYTIVRNAPIASDAFELDIVPAVAAPVTVAATSSDAALAVTLSPPPMARLNPGQHVHLFVPLPAPAPAPAPAAAGEGQAPGGDAPASATAAPAPAPSRRPFTPVFQEGAASVVYAPATARGLVASPAAADPASASADPASPAVAVPSPLPAGFMRFVVRRYDRGGVTAALARLPAGTPIGVAGPLGGYDYTPVSAGRVTHVLCVAGGTGITPLFQVVDAIASARLKRPSSVTLLYSSRTAEEVLLAEELAAIARVMPSLTIVHVITRGSDGAPAAPAASPVAADAAFAGAAGAAGADAAAAASPAPLSPAVLQRLGEGERVRVVRGRVTAELVASVLPTPTSTPRVENLQVLICGSRRFAEDVKGMLEAVKFNGLPTRSVHVF